MEMEFVDRQFLAKYLNKNLKFKGTIKKIKQSANINEYKILITNISIIGMNKKIDHAWVFIPSNKSFDEVLGKEVYFNGTVRKYMHHPKKSKYSQLKFYKESYSFKLNKFQNGKLYSLQDESKYKAHKLENLSLSEIKNKYKSKPKINQIHSTHIRNKRLNIEQSINFLRGVKQMDHFVNSRLAKSLKHITKHRYYVFVTNEKQKSLPQYIEISNVHHQLQNINFPHLMKKYPNYQIINLRNFVKYIDLYNISLSSKEFYLVFANRNNNTLKISYLSPSSYIEIEKEFLNDLKYQLKNIH